MKQEEKPEPLPEWLKEILEDARHLEELKQMIDEVRSLPKLPQQQIYKRPLEQ